MRDRWCARAEARKSATASRGHRAPRFQRQPLAAALRHSRLLPSASQSRAKWRRDRPRRIAAPGRTKCQSLIAQAVPLLQQDQTALIDIRNIDTTAQRPLVGCRHRQQKLVVEQLAASQRRRLPPAAPASRSRARRAPVPGAASLSASRAAPAASADTSPASAAARAAARKERASG